MKGRGASAGAVASGAPCMSGRRTRTPEAPPDGPNGFAPTASAIPAASRAAWRRTASGVALALALAGCGADAPPVPPGPPLAEASRPGPVVTVTGQAEAGVAGRL